MPRRAALIATLCALLAAPAAASVPDLFGYGARASALAGAVVSDPHGHAAVYYNPGALGFETKLTFAVGYQRADLALEIDGAERDARPASATLIGFGIPIPLGGFMHRRLTLGAGFVIPTNTVLVADIPRPGQPRFSLVENRAQTVTLQGALGLRLTDWLSIGGGVIALSELQGAIDVAPNAEGRIGSQARDQLVASYAPTAGLALRLPGDARVGVTYRGESKAEFELPITANLGDSFPLPVPTLSIIGVAQYDPRNVAVELSGTPALGLRVAAGFTWKQWSAYPNPIAYTAVPADFPAQPDPDFDDVFEWRGAAEWPLAAGPLTLTPRLGYQFAPSPVPEQTGLHNQLDSDRHLLGLGLGVQWDRLRLDLAGQWHHLTTREHTKDAAAIEAAGFDPATHPGVEGIEHDGDIFGFAIEVGVER